MLNSTLNYLHLTPSSDLPALEGLRQFKTILVADADVQEPMMWDVSRWLIDSGSLYVLVWGQDSEQWREAIEDAALEAVNYEDVPDERRVLVTAHEDDELDEVFWYARHRAAHPADLKHTLILHIADAPRREDLEAAYSDA
ncbi:hypothetical protein FHW58_002739 [Duganella sp. 1224]|uniref:DUF7684 family protein n=1 Tax=Duganella sp. 1224 TaxID=2587052 RepID=UPI0015CE4895|nr:hypothetical protein [Duganella sp. 1224]NYE61532.1 hypothetical protein [Duganella sp. 1224]